MAGTKLYDNARERVSVFEVNNQLELLVGSRTPLTMEVATAEEVIVGLQSAVAKIKAKRDSVDRY